MNIDNWKQANRIYADLLHLSINDAIQKLENNHDISTDIKHLVETLIHSGNQPSQYFSEHISSKYDVDAIGLNQFQAGQHIGDYELIEEIGKGGMSKVFSGKRISSDIQKPVAIKILSPNQNNSQVRKHFIAEQKILSGLTHANIITMHHGETTESGDSFIVMELIKNAVALDEHVKSNLSSITEIVQMILTTAHALAYAHSNLIIHRDIKPSNIIVAKDGTIKVVDFGIAKLISKDLGHDKTTIMALTPSFASPEQINAGKITITTDIFSLAAVCVSCIINDLPLPKDRLIKSCTGDEEHLWKVLRHKNINKDLRNILQQALQQDPNKRYNNMFQFAEDLDAWLHNKPVSATPDSWLYRLSKFAKRRRALFASIITLLFSMTAALVAFSWQYNKTVIEAQKAQQVKQFMLDAFNVTDPNVSEGIEISAKDLLKVSADKLDNNKDLNPEVKFELYQSIGIAYGQLGFLKTALDYLQKSIDIQPDNSKSLSTIALYLFNSGQQKQLDEFLKSFDENLFDSLPDKARIYRVRANSFAEKGEYDKALTIIKKLDALPMEAIEKMLNKRLLAEIYYLQGNSDTAIEIIQTAQLNSPLKNTHTLSLGLNNDLIHYYDRVGDFDSALKLSHEIIAHYRQILGDKHPDLGVALNELSVFYRLKGDNKNARIAAQEAHDIFLDLYGEYSTGLSQAFSNLALLSYLENDIDTATNQFNQSVVILEKIYSADHLETLNAKANLAWFLNATDRPEQAEKILQQVYKFEVEKLGATHRSPLLTQQALALTLASLKKYSQAIEHATTNVKHTSENYDKHNPITLNALSVLARIYFQSENYQQALDLFLNLEQQRPDGDITQYAKLLQDIAVSSVALDQFRRAESYYQKSINAYEDAYSATDFLSLSIKLEYAAFLKTQDKTTPMIQIINEVKNTMTTENIEDSRIDQLLDKIIQNH